MSRPPRPKPPLFLARQTYRRRRLMDLARLLPLLGCLLFLLPILWGPSDEVPEVVRHTAADGAYIFLVWLGLILAAFFIARGLAPELSAPEGEEEGR